MGLIEGFKYLKELKLGDKFCLNNSNKIRTFIKYEATNYNYREDSWHDSHYDYDEASCDVLIYTEEDKKPIKARMETSCLKYGWGRSKDKEKFHELAGEYVIKDASTRLEESEDLLENYNSQELNHYRQLENQLGCSLDVIPYLLDIINLKGYEDYIFEQIKDYDSYKENVNKVYEGQLLINWEDKKQLLELRLYTKEEFELMLNVLFKRKIKNKTKIKN